MNETRSIPIACELPEQEQKRCTDAYRSGLFSNVDAVRKRPGGYSLRFSWSPDRVRELGEFLALDSSCCSFLDHSVEIPRGKESIWLHLTASEEAQDVLKKEIELLLPTPLSLPGEEKLARATRFRWGTIGASGFGLAAVLCCAAPAVGALALAGMGAWFVDSLPALGVIAGIGLLVWLYSSRRAQRRANCCG